VTGSDAPCIILAWTLFESKQSQLHGGGSESLVSWALLRAEVLSADAFSAFEEAGLDDADAVAKKGRAFRDTVLSLGGGRAPALVFKAKPSLGTTYYVYGTTLFVHACPSCMLARGCRRWQGTVHVAQRLISSMQGELSMTTPVCCCCRTSEGGSRPRSRCCGTMICCRPLHELDLLLEL
jgi:hypothetical protein